MCFCVHVCVCWSLTAVSAVTGVRFPDDSAEDILKQKQLLKDAAAFLVSCQIPSLVRLRPLLLSAPPTHGPTSASSAPCLYAFPLLRAWTL